MPHSKKNQFISIEEAIADIAAGRMLIVVDDEDRENEGDLVIAADFITPDAINFMAKEARGLICTPVDPDIAERLNLHPMVAESDPGACNFSVSVDARYGIETGISAADRAHTIKRIMDDSSSASDFLRPGHVFPLRAKKGGSLVRAGHTEASVDLSKLAGLSGGAVICEIMNPDGTMARLPDLFRFSEKNGIRIISIESLIRYRRNKETLVEKVAHATIPTVFGIFEIHVFQEKLTGLEHVALVRGNIEMSEAPLVRVHSECLTGDVFRSLRCDCRSQLDAALDRIAEEGTGVLLRMAQEGRGIGLSAKIKAYELQDSMGLDTVEANEHLGFRDDLRDYGIGAQILKILGVSKMRLLTNNPRKIVGLSGYGLQIVEQLPIDVGESEHNAAYLKTKKEKLGHML